MKPTAIGDVPSGLSSGLHRLISALKERMEMLSGERRGSPVIDLAGLRSITISNPPTQAEVEFLRAQLVRLIERMEGTS